MKCLMISLRDGHQSSFGSIASGIARASMLENAATISVTFINYLQLFVPTFCYQFSFQFFFLFFPPPLLFWVSKKTTPLPLVANAGKPGHVAAGGQLLRRQLGGSQVAATHAAAELQLPRGVPWRRPKETPLDGKKLIQIPSLERSKRCRIDIQL